MFGIKNDEFFSIVEFKIVKETEKQYILQNTERVNYLYNKITVNKAKMRNIDYTFVHTIEEAKAVRKQDIKFAMTMNEKRIEHYKKQNEQFLQILKEME